jgi:hypothetical protein
LDVDDGARIGEWLFCDRDDAVSVAGRGKNDLTCRGVFGANYSYTGPGRRLRPMAAVNARKTWKSMSFAESRQQF